MGRPALVLPFSVVAFCECRLLPLLMVCLFGRVTLDSFWGNSFQGRVSLGLGGVCGVREDACAWSCLLFVYVVICVVP